METIGQRFKQIRLAERLSQEEFGNFLKMTKSGISAVENDKVFVSVEVLKSLFINKNINLNWFICGKGQMFNPPVYDSIRNEIIAEVEKMLDEKGIK